MADSSNLQTAQETVRLAQRLLRENLALDALKVEDEIRMRVKVAEASKALFEMSNDLSHLDEAIHHFEVICQRLPSGSESKHEYLNQLCHLQTSNYEARQNMLSLDNAIRYGFEAKAAQIADTDFLIDVNQNLGYALSKKAQLLQHLPCLDQAIECGQDTLNLLADQPNTSKHQIESANLALRFLTRFGISKAPSDLEEARRLGELNADRFPLGSQQREVALQGRSQFSTLTFYQTQTDQDLSRAILDCTAPLGIRDLPQQRRLALLAQLISLHVTRFKRHGDVFDIREATRYSQERLDMADSPNGIPAEHIAVHLSLLCQTSLSELSLPTLQRTVKAAETLLRIIPDTYPMLYDAHVSYGELLAKTYLLTKDLSDFRKMVRQAAEVKSAFDSKKKSTEMPLKSIDALVDALETINNTSKEEGSSSPTFKKISDWFEEEYRSQNWITSILQLNSKHRDELRNIANPIKKPNFSIVHNSEKAQTAGQPKDKPDADTAKNETYSHRTQDYKDPFSGIRQLAMHEDSKEILFSAPILAQSIFGYSEEDLKQQDWRRLFAREFELEEEAAKRETQAGQDPNPHLCRVCRRLRILVPDSKGFLWQKKGLWMWGALIQVFCRSFLCNICHLMMSMITFHHGMRIYPRLLELDPEVQVINLRHETLSTGERMLIILWGQMPVGGLRILTAENWVDVARQGRDFDLSILLPRPKQTKAEYQIKMYNLMCWMDQIEPNIDMKMSSFDERISRTNKSIASRKLSDQVLDHGKLRRWLFNCYHNHSKNCNSAWTYKRAQTSFSLLLIDVEHSRLVRSTTEERYFALSYVWGKVEMHSTLELNLKQRMVRGSLDSVALPATLRDAMRLVKMVGVRYLWTDALCIVQDDMKQKHSDIARMDVIYNRAFATIVALDGTNADDGLPGVRPNSRPPQRSGSIWVTDRSPDLALRDAEAHKSEMITVVPTPPPLYLAIDASTWDQRGWILQERALSRRILYFTADYVYYQCAQEILCESRLEHYSPSDREPLSVRECKGPLYDLVQAGFSGELQKKRVAWDTYQEAVDSYTRRRFSFPSDILNGFAGLTAVFDDYLETTSIFALPVAALDLALLWTPAGPTSRRLIWEPENAKSAADRSSSGPTLQLPSWSWAGWLGRAEYRTTSFRNEGLPYPTVTNFYRYDELGLIYRLDAGESIEEDDRYGSVGQRPRNPLQESTTRSTDSNDLASTKTDIPSLRHPTVLHFHADTISASAFGIVSTHGMTTPPRITCRGSESASLDMLSKRSNPHMSTNQPVLRLRNDAGHQCGLLYAQQPRPPPPPPSTSKSTDQQTQYSPPSSDDAQSELLAPSKPRRLELAAISRYPDTYERRKGPNRVEGEIELFDENAFRCVGPGSGLVNALLLEWRDSDGGVAVAERLGVAQVHASAWDEAGPVRKLIRLG